MTCCPFLLQFYSENHQTQAYEPLSSQFHSRESIFLGQRPLTRYLASNTMLPSSSPINQITQRFPYCTESTYMQQQEQTFQKISWVMWKMTKIHVRKKKKKKTCLIFQFIFEIHKEAPIIQIPLRKTRKNKPTFGNYHAVFFITYPSFTAIN